MTCLRLRVGRDDGEIGDAADIQSDAAEFGVAIDDVIDERNERRALAAGGDVGGTEIADRRDSGACCDYCGLADLKS